MKRAPILTVAVLSATLLTACAQEKPELRPTRSAGEGAWYKSTKDERTEYCEAYRANDPQRPIMIPSYASAESEDEFADDFYNVLKKKC
ncbi:hypothetical protein GTW43_09510 [Streptomyces sp. SID5785]|uniref:hypothetical protein n=1 Tax=Streptomyces sp. SID5785 TaxID=2690309 RepID=UPI0013613965|nr:hypothetical protein [Streptomyces sp. SID5785]MZD05317.1 hypothetical protein [Streptomyces sp. SID5785]